MRRSVADEVLANSGAGIEDGYYIDSPMSLHTEQDIFKCFI